MKKYSIPRQIWRAVNFPLAYLGIQLGITFLISFIYSFYINFTNALNGNSNTEETIEVVNSFVENTMIWCLLAACLLCIFIFFIIFKHEKNEYSEPQMKLNGKSVLLSVGATLGIISVVLMLFIIVDIYSIFPSYKNVENNLSYSDNYILQLIVYVILIPVTEELCFRGITFKRLSRSMNIVAAIIIQSIIFGVVHFNLFQGLYAFIFGLLLGYVYYKYKNLLLCIILHGIFNLFGGFLGQLLETEFVFNNKYIVFTAAILITAVFVYLIIRHKPYLSEAEYILLKGKRYNER